MSFLPLEILPSSREFDELFQLIQKSTQVKADYTSYVWTAPKPYFFKGCDYTKIFPLALNLYLKVCSPQELKELLTEPRFLRVNMDYRDEACATSSITVANLTLAGLVDPEYKKLLLSCPKDKIPCVINMGPLWHYLGADRAMVKAGRIELGATGLFISSFPPKPGYVMGFELFGRDAYPTETSEEEIKAREQSEEIFILRK